MNKIGKTKQMKANELKEGMFMITSDSPVLIDIVNLNEQGDELRKDDVLVVGEDIIKNIDVQLEFSYNDVIDVFYPQFIEYKITNINKNGQLELMTKDGETKKDLKLGNSGRSKKLKDEINKNMEDGAPQMLTVMCFQEKEYPYLVIKL